MTKRTPGISSKHNRMKQRYLLEEEQPAGLTRHGPHAGKNSVFPRLA